MSSFAILRTAKIKSAVAVARACAHDLRERQPANADLARTVDNKVLAGAADQPGAVERFNARLETQKHVRKNAVLAIEYLVTASPEVLQAKSRGQQDDYFAAAVRWLEQRHGAENIVTAQVHRDEQTPHLHAIVVPIDHKGKLNCRSFLGGADALRKMQTDFAEQVGKPHGLERGTPGSKAKHQRVSQYYTRVNAAFQPLPPVKTPPPRPLRPAPPAKPWWKRVFMSAEARQQYNSDHENWRREKSKHDATARQRAQEIKAQRDAAVDTARRLQAQAADAASLRKNQGRLETSLAQESQRSKADRIESRRLRDFLSFFTPAEVQAAESRRRERDHRVAAEHAQQERERQEHEHQARVALAEANFRRAEADEKSSTTPTHPRSKRFSSSSPTEMQP